MAMRIYLPIRIDADIRIIRHVSDIARYCRKLMRISASPWPSLIWIAGKMKQLCTPLYIPNHRAHVIEITSHQITRSVLQCKSQSAAQNSAYQGSVQGSQWIYQGRNSAQCKEGVNFTAFQSVPQSSRTTTEPTIYQLSDGKCVGIVGQRVPWKVECIYHPCQYIVAQ